MSRIMTPVLPGHYDERREFPQVEQTAHGPWGGVHGCCIDRSKRTFSEADLARSLGYRRLRPQPHETALGAALAFSIGRPRRCSDRQVLARACSKLPLDGPARSCTTGSTRRTTLSRARRSRIRRQSGIWSSLGQRTSSSIVATWRGRKTRNPWSFASRGASPDCVYSKGDVSKHGRSSWRSAKVSLDFDTRDSTEAKPS